MRVGITTDLRHSMFSAGHANTTLSLALMLQTLGHEVIFLHKQEDQDWWDDCKELASAAPKRYFLETFLQTEQPLDLVIESSFFLSPLQRPKVAKRSIWYNRKPSLFTDIESTVYGCRPDGRNLEGLSAVLVADVFTCRDDIIYFQTLYPTIPIYTVPWIWTPEIVESHRKTTQSPVWLQVFKAVESDVKWSFHIAETNMSSTSSCTLPLVIMRNLSVNSVKKVPISRITVHNTELLRDNKFFKENILSHCSVPDLSYNLFGRQRIIDWVHDPKSIILSHNRFVSLKMANIEAAWVGIPIIHNSEILKSFGSGLEKLYYEGNSVTGACAAIDIAVFNTSDIPYLQSLDGLSDVRKQILSRFYPAVKADGWGKAFQLIFDTPLVVAPKLAPVAALAPVATPPLVPVDDERMDRIEQALQFLHQKQNNQYGMLLESIQNLNTNLSKVVAMLSDQAKEVIETATTIPNIQPTAEGSDLKTVCISDVSQALDLATPDTPHGFDSPAYDEEAQSDIDAEQGDVEEEVEVEEEEEEEGIEVEDWVYKGRKFFKDTENTVYANNDGEIGDPIGVYDPVKNIVKKLPVT